MRQNIWAALLLLNASVLSAEIRPVAISALAGGKIIAIDATNALMITDKQSSFVQMFSVPKQNVAIDLAADGRLEENMIFIATRGMDISLSPIMQYISQGSKLQRWIIPNPNSYPAGVALDYPNRLLYVSTLKDASIYQIDLKREGGEKPVYLMQVPGAMRLGALAVDVVGQRLFAADPFSGKVYVVSLATRQSSLFASGLGEPAALAIGRGANRLYIADKVRRCVWVVRQNQGQTNPQIFWSSNSLREPIGLTVDSDGVVWIGDKVAKAVFGIDANGHEVTTLH